MSRPWIRLRRSGCAAGHFVEVPQAASALDHGLTALAPQELNSPVTAGDLACLGDAEVNQLRY
jgi:hypothetical protein